MHSVLVSVIQFTSQRQNDTFPAPIARDTLDEKWLIS
jgi:hypothetical protein